jgi:hypothetical protein
LEGHNLNIRHHEDHKSHTGNSAFFPSVYFFVYSRVSYKQGDVSAYTYPHASLIQRQIIGGKYFLNNSVVFSPQANYTDREIDRRLLAKLVPTFADREGVAWSAQRIPPVVNSVFLTGAATFSFK